MSEIVTVTVTASIGREARAVSLAKAIAEVSRAIAGNVLIEVQTSGPHTERVIRRALDERTWEDKTEAEWIESLA